MSLSQYIFLNKSIVLVLNIYYLSYGMIARSSGNERMFATCSVIDNSYTLNVFFKYADLKSTANEIFINQSKGYIIITVSL